MLEEQEAHHQALKAQLQEALAAARAAATDVMMLQAQLKSERGETDGLLQAIGLICGPGIVGEVKRKARYAAEHGMIPREDPGDDDNSANGDNERNDARNEINGQKMAPKVNDVSENGRRKSPTPVASNPRENGTATQRMDRPANGSSQNGGKNGSRPAVNDLENSDSSSSESSPETTYLSRLRGRLFSKRQREDDDAGESDRDAHEAHAGDDTVIIEDPSQIDDTVRQHKRARRGRSPTDQDEGSSSGSESSSPSASGPPSQASSHKQQLPQRSILGLASRPRPPPTQPRARKLKPKQLKRDKERIVINRDTGEIVHYVPDYTQTKEYKWRVRRGEQDLVAKPAMPIDLEAEIRTLVGTKGTEERFEFSDDIPEGDIIFDEDY
ncbi:hypothetical protein BDZ97DRAFT_1862657 [Flammula alnicola]|nr:hypothetical protein BDZ97DRAFT_1862657 [Flammula alnicola]